MSEYDELLDKAQKEAEEFRVKAKDYVPRMYKALLAEGQDPMDAKDRIEKDLVGIWTKDTIRRSLPQETKNPKQSEAARKVNRKRKAGLVPALKSEEKEISRSIQPLVVLHNDGKEITAASVENPAIKGSPEEDIDASTSNLGDSQKVENNPDDRKATATDKLFTVHRDKFAALFAALRNSKQVCYLKFDNNRELLHVRADDGPENPVGLDVDHEY